jgi:hypothetical protein
MFLHDILKQFSDNNSRQSMGFFKISLTNTISANVRLILCELRLKKFSHKIHKQFFSKTYRGAWGIVLR